ncbi:MAG TPA: alpha,alpha-trehalase TreF [Luteimonas sp.]|nr:alpha,alpha-trehalase TreF [Luteimonas sp.]
MRDEPDNAARVADVAPADPLSPAERYGELFVAVQCGRVFADSKVFVDCVPVREPDTILEEYRARKDGKDFDLARFVAANFETTHPPPSDYVSDPDQPLAAHIDNLWDVLTRHPRQHRPYSSLLPLPRPYVVPGGRFGELYYWDSYFTMLGLAESGRHDLLRAMADNFAWLIDCYGHVPNGNRSYYLSRSQPPVFALMVELFEVHGVSEAVRYLPRLRREHAFWMEGSEGLEPGEARRHCACMPDGSVLNRYWDELARPREEEYLEDVTTAASQSARPAEAVYRDLRAAAASGWDFSSRWFDAGEELSATRTTSIVPVDLNAFLFALEEQIADLSRKSGDEATAAHFGRLCRARAEAIERWLWDERAGAYFDYDLLRDGIRSHRLCAAAATPLFTGIASRERALRTAGTLRERLLQHGGMGTTEVDSAEQWDAPNGWAPLQWMTVAGCRLYGLDALADEIRHRWLGTVGSLYARESKLVEKYVLAPTGDGAIGGGGGEYPLQDGFGWTNGVTRRMLRDAPGDPAHRARAGRLHSG